MDFEEQYLVNTVWTCLSLDFNKLTCLPESIVNLTSLKELKLIDNPLEEGELERIKTHLPKCMIIIIS
tara:strand:- start:1183 stop:1386 length:204 start_codon:yes stop_codon:yes gene_type:complete